MKLSHIIKESIDNIVLEKEVYESVDKNALYHLCKTKETNYKAMQNGKPNPMQDVDVSVRCGRYVKYPDIQIYDVPTCYEAIINTIDMLAAKTQEKFFEIMLVYEDGSSEKIGEVSL